MTHLEILIFALVLDALIGEPENLWHRIPHPAALMGHAISRLDTLLNKGTQRRIAGVLALSILLVVTATIGILIACLPDFGIIEALFAAVLLAQKSLTQHVSAVARGLEISLSEGRNRVAMVVGRDVKALDENGVTRSSIESAAENFSDGIIAPAFWLLLFGLPGIMIYKMINTADSMIGYRNEKYAEFGWTAARLDDLVNYIPARLTGLLICAAHASTYAFKVMMRDANLHRSPNAGWPEAATAAVTGVAISGPRTYEGFLTDDPFVHAEGRRDLIPADIDHAVNALWRSWALLVSLLILVWVL